MNEMRVCLGFSLFTIKQLMHVYSGTSTAACKTSRNHTKTIHFKCLMSSEDNTTIHFALPLTPVCIHFVCIFACVNQGVNTKQNGMKSITPHQKRHQVSLKP